MSLNLAAVGQSVDAGSLSWDSSDAIRYALGVGAGAEDPTAELAFTTENTEGVAQQVLPTFGVVLGARERRPELGDFSGTRMLHAEQSLELFGPLPVSGTARTTATILGFDDKGADALAHMELTLTDESTGQKLAVSRSTVFVRGEGGFGGERGSSPAWQRPERPADDAVTYRTRTDQALLYRLSGDRNPLHSDPGFATRAGFERPILHGLCTYGFTGRALLHKVCGGDVARFGRITARFASPVAPGEELTVHIWRDDAPEATAAAGIETFRFRTRAGDRIVLDRGTFTTRKA
ncbi:MaoC/PaaZ C-terminal domain-containing protein [Streptomyces sp. NPDC050161]|uniref:MaoC/PaaZ C-terminal domain-containing protein n=1 Tax=Streptomyces sp. NPDC050161 TaxID=3365604 RepID=UPI00378EBDEC